MRYRDRRSQIGNLLLDGLGLVFVLISGFSIYVVVFLLVTFGDDETAFPFGIARARQATAGSLKITGLILFALIAIASAGAANVFLDHPVARFRRWRRRRAEDERT